MWKIPAQIRSEAAAKVVNRRSSALQWRTREKIRSSNGWTFTKMDGGGENNGNCRHGQLDGITINTICTLQHFFFSFWSTFVCFFFFFLSSLSRLPLPTNTATACERTFIPLFCSSFAFSLFGYSPSSATSAIHYLFFFHMGTSVVVGPQSHRESTREFKFWSFSHWTDIKSLIFRTSSTYK